MFYIATHLSSVSLNCKMKKKNVDINLLKGVWQGSSHCGASSGVPKLVEKNYFSNNIWHLSQRLPRAGHAQKTLKERQPLARRHPNQPSTWSWSSSSCSSNLQLPRKVERTLRHKLISCSNFPLHEYSRLITLTLERNLVSIVLPAESRRLALQRSSLRFTLINGNC